MQPEEHSMLWCISQYRGAVTSAPITRGDGLLSGAAEHGSQGVALPGNACLGLTRAHATTDRADDCPACLHDNALQPVACRCCEGMQAVTEHAGYVHSLYAALAHATCGHCNDLLRGHFNWADAGADDLHVGAPLPGARRRHARRLRGGPGALPLLLRAGQKWRACAGGGLPC